MTYEYDLVTVYEQKNNKLKEVFKGTVIEALDYVTSVLTNNYETTVDYDNNKQYFTCKNKTLVTDSIIFEVVYGDLK